MRYFYLLLAICASTVCHAQNRLKFDGHLGLAKVNLEGALTDPYKINAYEVGVDLVKTSHMFSLSYTSYKADDIQAGEKGWPEVKHNSFHLGYTRAISSFLVGFSVGSGSTTQPLNDCTKSGSNPSERDNKASGGAWSASLGAQLSRNLDIQLKHMTQGGGEDHPNSNFYSVNYHNRIQLTWHFRGGHAKPLFGRR